MAEAQEGTEPSTATPDKPAAADQPKAAPATAATAATGTAATATTAASAKEGSAPSAGARLAARRAAKAAKKAAKRGTETTAEEQVADELEQTAAQASSWLDENKNKLLGLMGAVVVVGGAIVAMTSHNRAVSGDAAAQLHEGVEALLAPISAEDIEAVEDITTYPTEEARANEALTAFQKTQSEFGDSAAAAWARLGEANGLRQLGKHDEALAAYNGLADAEDPALRHYALLGAGMVLEGLGKHEAAKAKFEAAAKADGERYAPPAQYQAARMLVAMGKKDEAIKQLKQLVEVIGTLGAGGPSYAGVKNQADTLLAELGEAPAPTAGGGAAPDGAALQKLLQQLNLGDKGLTQ